MDMQRAAPRTHSHGPVIGWLGTSPSPAIEITTLLSRHGYQLRPASPEAAASYPLILIDCQQCTASGTRQYLAQLVQLAPHSAVALIGAPARGPHEQLISCPLVKGIFPGEGHDDHLLKGIRALLAGENWFSRRILDDWLNRQRTSISLPPMPEMEPGLTERERQILGHINQAFTNGQIADALSISEHTVKTHLYNIFRKIGVRNRTQASNWVKANLSLICT